MLSESRFRELVSGRWRGPVAAGLRGVLAAAEVGYAWEVRRRNRRFDSGRVQPAVVEAPVISVGNLTVGGTGKTPLVLWIGRWLKSRGHEVTIISRGYGRQSNAPNDEALELAARLPGVKQIQNPDRVAAAREAVGRASGPPVSDGLEAHPADTLEAHPTDTLEAHPTQVLVLDDAFQHRRIARDLDIVLLDALEPFGYEHLLPRGLLREPIESLSRAAVVALSRADAVSEARRREIEARVRSLAPQALWLELAHQPTALVSHAGQSQPLEAWRGKRVAAFCGIGNPAGFRHTLASCGLGVAALREFPDHFAYPPRAIAELETWLGDQSGIEAAVCTRKDLVKLPRETLGKLPLLALEIDLAITVGRERLEERLGALVAREFSKP
jgi:tetraacyldisaccharide 4'-kinase